MSWRTAGRSPQRLIWMVIFGLAAAAGLTVRLTTIDESFWYDEAVSANRYFGESIPAIVGPGNAHPNNHPLYSLSVRVLWAVQESEVTARLPSLIAWGVLLVVSFLLARRLFAERAAWTTVIILAVAPWPLRYSIEARGNMMATALGALAIYLLVVGLEEDRVWVRRSAAGSLALAAFAHFYAVVLLAAALAVWLGIRGIERDRLGTEILAFTRWAVVALSGVFLLYLPSQYIIDVLAHLFGDADQGVRFSVTEPQEFDVSYARSLLGFHIAGRSTVWGLAVVAVPWAAAFAAHRRDRRAIGFLTAPLVVVAATVVGGLVFHLRFFLVIQPLVVIGVAAGLVWLVERLVTDARAVAVVVGVVAVLMTLLPAGGFPDRLPMQIRDWDEAAEHIDREGLVVVANPIGPGWSVVREALGYYLGYLPERDPTPELAAGQTVAYVRLGNGTVERAYDVAVGEPLRFGDVQVFHLTWTGVSLVSAGG